MAVQKTTEASFQTDVLDNPSTVLVDFFADWCGPCKMLAPVVEEISNEVADCKFFKLNVDDAPGIAAKYRVMSIPTLIVFKQGKDAAQSVGVQSKQNIIKMIQNA
ncbi:MAG: thioredoxin [Eubacteriales bacterium]|nr:thioredoxin [Eubacteriales bacterium]